MIDVEHRQTLEQFDALEHDWERLFRLRGAQASLSFEWSRALLCNHLASSRDWFVTVLRQDGAVVGLVPMMYARGRVLGVPVVTLQPIQELYRTHGGILLDATDASLITAWLKSLDSSPQRWDLLRVSGLLEDDPLIRTFLSGVLGDAHPRRIRFEQPAFYLPLPSTFQEYLATRSGKFRNYLKRAAKKLESAGVVTFTRLRHIGDFQAQYEELLAIERSSWKHGHGTAISAIAHQSAFYRDLARAALERGRLHLTFLRVDDRPVAYNLGLISNGCYSYLKTSYLESMRSLGVATVGRARLIEQLIVEGANGFDFPGEPYEWEQQWTKDMRWHRSLLVFNSTPKAGLVRVAVRALGIFSRRNVARSVVFQNARSLRAPDP
jgi:CelD/BcsL family acetyltransferase involved in cellulose biosynthesis